MELKIYPDPILKQICSDVKIGDDSVNLILEEMTSKLYEWNGAGLAAPQVGISKKMVVIDIRDEPATLFKMINPKIINKSEELIESHEGCLSLPMLRETVLRHEHVTVAYLDENFKEKELTARGFLSCCLQHEIDHLHGKIYLDRLNKIKRNLALQRFYQIKQKIENNEPVEEEQ